MAGRHLQSARAELDLDALVGDDVDLAIDDGNAHPRPDKLARSATSAGIYGNRYVAEHRRPVERLRSSECRSPSRNADSRIAGQMVDDRSWWTTSRSEIAVSQRGHQLTMRLAR